MASRIAGITIQIGGDTTKLQSSLKGVDKSLRQTQSALKDVNKLLKFNPGNTELLVQKQRNLKKAVDDTKERLRELKKTAENVTPEDIGQDKYDALGRPYTLRELTPPTDERMRYLLSVAEESGLICQIGG
jgi:phage-related minor tail protein